MIMSIKQGKINIELVKDKMEPHHNQVTGGLSIQPQINIRYFRQKFII